MAVNEMVMVNLERRKTCLDPKENAMCYLTNVLLKYTITIIIIIIIYTISTYGLFGTIEIKKRE
jgi:hypothetical protein